MYCASLVYWYRHSPPVVKMSHILLDWTCSPPYPVSQADFPRPLKATGVPETRGFGVGRLSLKGPPVTSLMNSTKVIKDQQWFGCIGLQLQGVSCYNYELVNLEDPERLQGTQREKRATNPVSGRGGEFEYITDISA